MYTVLSIIYSTFGGGSVVTTASEYSGQSSGGFGQGTFSTYKNTDMYFSLDTPLSFLHHK